MPKELTDYQIRCMLFEIARDKTSYVNFEERHIEKLNSFEILENGKVQFWITRHPHLFRAPSLGGPSSAFIPKRYLFELDPKTRNVSLLKKEIDDPVINYILIADTEVVSYFDSFGDDYFEDFEHMKTEDEVIEFAGTEFQQIPWYPDDILEYENVPQDFLDNALEAIRKVFISSMRDLWHSFNTMKENGEL